MPTRDILDLSKADLEAWCEGAGFPTYRAAQIAVWLYRHGVADFTTMKNLPGALRERLASDFSIGASA